MKKRTTIATLLLGASLTLSQEAVANPRATPTSSHCLALNVYHEARDQGIEGWLAVAMVTRNRKETPNTFPDTWCEVVYAPYAFSWTHDHLPDTPKEKAIWRRIKVFVGGFLANHRYIKDPTEGAVDYHSGPPEKIWWAAHYKLYKVIGDHYFYHRL